MNAKSSNNRNTDSTSNVEKFLEEAKLEAPETSSVPKPTKSTDKVTVIGQADGKRVIKIEEGDEEPFGDEPDSGVETTLSFKQKAMAVLRNKKAMAAVGAAASLAVFGIIKFAQKHYVEVEVGTNDEPSKFVEPNDVETTEVL